MSSRPVESREAGEAAGTRPGKTRADPAGVANRRLSQLARIPVTELKGVGPRKAAALRELGIATVLDLIVHYPRRFVDRTNAMPIAALEDGEEALVSVVVRKVTLRRLKGGRMLVGVEVADSSGSLFLSFFNQEWRAKQLRTGAEVVVFGRAEAFRGRMQMANPVLDVIEGKPGERRQTGRVVALYPRSGKAAIASSEISAYVAEALERAGRFADPLPDAERDHLGLVDRTAAFRGIHLPGSIPEQLRARRRLAFDELLRLQVELVQRKRVVAAGARGIAHAVTPGAATPDLVGSFLEGLPFPLTSAQARAIEEIANDLGAPFPMHRLLQGDVGAGKTVVALATLLFAVQGGHQGALMVPTEVLAEQHFLSCRELLAHLELAAPDRVIASRPVEIALLTSRTRASERARICDGLRTGSVDLVVGTHALITDDVAFCRLGAVVVDEQHRFGVDQRAALRDKGEGRDPDLLVMTATPIPRTAAMTVYGDLDATVLDELPAGRSPVETIWLKDPGGEVAAFERVRAEVALGHQAFVVCPLVAPGDQDGADPVETAAAVAAAPGAPPQAPHGDAPLATPGGQSRATPGGQSRATPGGQSRATSDGLFRATPGGQSRAVPGEPPRLAPRAAVEEHARLAGGELASIPLGLLHGQLPSREKEQAMADFRTGATKVLVATTVVEVGVDVPNATVMVVLDADRFGIAQLHQLRGRVGRSGAASWCFLVTGEVTDDAKKRLDALVASSDGFELAEADLELRGEGTLLGARQKGRNDLRLASIRTDADLVVSARAVAERLVGDDPRLGAHPLLGEELRLFIGDEEAEYLQRS